MILSMLIILRDQGIALPAGAILISPWVDLCHSFPSLVQGKCGTRMSSSGRRVTCRDALPRSLFRNISSALLILTNDMYHRQ